MRSNRRRWNYLVFDPTSDLKLMKRIIIHRTTCNYVQNRREDDRRYTEFPTHVSALSHAKVLAKSKSQVVVVCARCKPWFPPTTSFKLR